MVRLQRVQFLLCATAEQLPGEHAIAGRVVTPRLRGQTILRVRTLGIYSLHVSVNRLTQCLSAAGRRGGIISPRAYDHNDVPPGTGG